MKLIFTRCIQKKFPLQEEQDLMGSKFCSLASRVWSGQGRGEEHDYNFSVSHDVGRDVVG